MTFAVYLLIGVLSGALSGLLGIGGGIVVVPALLFWFQHAHLFANKLAMYLAAGTSLAAMIGTTLSAATTYHRSGMVVWPIFLRFFPGLCVGMIMGAVLARYLSGRALIDAFAVFLLLIAAHLLLSKAETMNETTAFRNHRHFDLRKQPFSTTLLILGVAMCVGMLSTLFGIGGGLLIVPFFLFLGIPMNESSGTSSLCGVPISIFGTLILMFSTSAELPSSVLPWGTIGHVYWPAAMSIMTSSMLFAYLGSRFAVMIKPLIRKLILSAILILCAMNMLFSG